MKKLKIVSIDSKYCDYLRKFDSKVSYNAGVKELRPFVGVLFTVNKRNYYAPLSSPKEKHMTLKNTLDIFKIDNGKLGIINFNNMIPVADGCYKFFDLDNLTDDEKTNKRILLLRNQSKVLNKNKTEVYTKSKVLYSLYKNDKLPSNVKNRCCNFILLEEKCKQYEIDKEFVSN